MAFGAGSLADAYIKVRYDDSSLRSELGRIKSTVSSGLSSIAGVAGGILAASGFQAINEGLVGVARGFIQANAQMEQYRVALGVMLRDQNRANRLLAEMEEFARRTPFETASLIRATQLLKSYGFEVDQLLPMLRSIGDAAAASPEGMEAAVGRISLALGQMKAQGKVMGQEMNQLANAGVPAWDILAEQSGLTIAEVREKTRSGAISGAQAVEMLLKGFDTRFGGMMEKQSRSFGGLMSTMRDTAQILMRQIGEPLFAIAKVKLTNIADWLDTPAAEAWADSMRRGVASAIDMISAGVAAAFSEQGKQAMKAAAQIGAVVLALQGLIALAGTLKLVGAGLAFIGALNLPLLAVASAIGMVAVALVDLDGKLSPLRRTLVKMMNDFLGIETAAYRAAKALDFAAAAESIMDKEKAWRSSVKDMRDRKGGGKQAKPLDPLVAEMEEQQKSQSGEVRSKITEGMKLFEQRIEQVRQLREEQKKFDAQIAEQQRLKDDVYGPVLDAYADKEIAILESNKANNQRQIDIHKAYLAQLRDDLYALFAEEREIKQRVAREFGPNKLAEMGGALMGAIPKSLTDSAKNARNRIPMSFSELGGAIGGIGGALAGFLTSGGAGVGKLARSKSERDREAAEAAKALGISPEELKAMMDKSKTLAEREKARQALIDRGIDPSMLPGDDELFGGRSQSPQFMAADQIGRSIQSSLRLDRDAADRRRMLEAEEEAAEEAKKGREALEKIEKKLPLPMGFKE